MSKYEPGQVWRYKNRPGEDASRVIVGKIEHHGVAGNLVHVQVIDVAMKVPASPDGVARILHHSPFTEAAIDQSVTELVAEERRLANFVDFIGEGRGSQALAKALVETERRVEVLREELDGLRRSGTPCRMGPSSAPSPPPPSRSVELAIDAASPRTVCGTSACTPKKVST